MEYTAKLKTVLEYIDAHYAEELSISALASLCYFSEYHFMRFFKRFMGTSCLNYIKNLRLEKAAELLGQDGLTPGRLPVRRLPQPVLLLPGIPEKIWRDPGGFPRNRCPEEIGFIIGNIIPERSSGTESLKQNARVSSLPLSAIHSVSLPRLNTPRMCPTNPQTMSGLPSSTKHTSSQT